MLFNTPLFLVFLLIVIPTYCMLPKTPRKGFLLLAGYLFYGYWDWRFCGLLLISTIIDYYLGLALHYQQDPAAKKRLLYISLLVNLSILGFFKYFNFFIDNFSSLFGVLDSLHMYIILPVGISFYTFQSLSYTFDIYRGKLEPSKSLLDYALFVSFFPQLVAGPIEKAIDLLPQVEKSPLPTKKDISRGLSLITIGMFKKVMIGDTCAKYVDHLFTEPSYYTSGELSCALLLFAVQIYADFSGYSTIAKGAARLMGIEVTDNFRQPYLSSNITEFWRRWHISLSNWLKDYVYIWWLGGNRKGKWRTYLNLMLTMLIGGLWHGANWTFVIWGGLHGLSLALHKMVLGNRPVQTEYRYTGIRSFLRFLLNLTFCFAFVVFCWLFFRAENINSAFMLLSKISNWTSSEVMVDFITITLTYYIVMFSIDIIEYRTKRLDFLMLLKPPIRYGIIVPVWVFILMYMYTVVKPMPFIYFQF